MSEIISTEQELKGALNEALLSQGVVLGDDKMNAVARVVNPEAVRFVTCYGSGQVIVPAYTSFVLDREGTVTEFPVITGVNSKNKHSFTAIAEDLSLIYREGNPLFKAVAGLLFSKAGVLSEMHEDLTEDIETPGPVLLGGGMILYRSKSEGVRGADYVGREFADKIGHDFELGEELDFDRNMIDTMLTTINTPQANAMRPLLDRYGADEVFALLQTNTILRLLATQATMNTLGVLTTPKILRPQITI